METLESKQELGVNAVVEGVLEAKPSKRKEVSEKYKQMLVNMRLTPRTKLALRLWSAGIGKEEICKATSLSSSRFDFIRWSPVGQSYLKTVMVEHEERFKMLFGKVVRYIDEGLDCSDYDVRDKAAKLWAGMSGRLMHTVKVERSAEDNVKDLIDGKAIDVTPVQEGNRDPLQDSEQTREDS